MNHQRIILYDLLFISLLSVLALVSVLSYQRINDFTGKADQVSHTQYVDLKLNELLINIVNGETGQRGFLLTHDSSFLQPYLGSIDKIKKNIEELDSLTTDNPVQERNLKNLSLLVQDRLSLLSRNISLFSVRGASLEELKPWLEEGKEMMTEIRKRISFMMKVEDNLLQQRISKKNRLAYITPLYSLLFSICGLIFVTIAYFRVRKEISLRYKAEKNALESQQQQKLSKEAENRLLNFADNVPVMIWLCDSESSCYFFNSQWLEFTGRTIEQEKGHGWMQNIHPDDMAAYNDTFEFSFEGRHVFYMEYRLKRADGTYRWLSVKGVPRYGNDQVFIGYAAGCMDIEEQKNFSLELEKKVSERTLELKNLNALLQIKNDIFAYAEENALLGSYSWNLQTGELEYSDNLFRMFGYKPREFEPSFEKFISLIHPDDKEQVIADGEKTFSTKVLSSNTYRVITRQGEIKYFRSSGNFIGDDKELLVGSVQDITKDNLLTDTLTQKNLELQRNNEELESFTYIASHDLQEPLRKIQSFSKILLEQEAEIFSEKGRDYFRRIISAAERMQHLIESLLNYSRVNMSEIKFVPTDLNAVLEDVKQNLSEKLSEKKAVIESTVLPNLNVVPMHIYQLFSNLIINSVKYSKAEEPPFVTISTTVVSGEEIMADVAAKKKKFWKFVFTDNGIGFEPQYEQKIFELFQRLHGRTEYEGTGIGLAICKKIVHNHNGYITAKGKPGVGASFVIYLPVEN